MISPKDLGCVWGVKIFSKISRRSHRRCVCLCGGEGVGGGVEVELFLSLGDPTSSEGKSFFSKKKNDSVVGEFGGIT